MQNVFFFELAGLLLAELDAWRMVSDACFDVLSGIVWNGWRGIFLITELRELYYDAVEDSAYICGIGSDLHENDGICVLF